MILFIIHGGGVQNIMKEIEELCPDCIIEKTYGSVMVIEPPEYRDGLMN